MPVSTTKQDSLQHMDMDHTSADWHKEWVALGVGCGSNPAVVCQFQISLPRQQGSHLSRPIAVGYCGEVDKDPAVMQQQSHNLHCVHHSCPACLFQHKLGLCCLSWAILAINLWSLIHSIIYQFASWSFFFTRWATCLWIWDAQFYLTKGPEAAAHLPNL